MFVALVALMGAQVTFTLSQIRHSSIECMNDGKRKVKKSTRVSCRT